jgi:hypothetical protein
VIGFKNMELINLQIKLLHGDCNKPGFRLWEFPKKIVKVVEAENVKAVPLLDLRRLYSKSQPDTAFKSATGGSIIILMKTEYVRFW